MNKLFQILISSKKFSVPDGDPQVINITKKVIAPYDPNATNGGWFGRASVVVRNGIVILTYREGTEHAKNLYGQIHIRFSDDYGNTWSDEDKYLDGSSVSGFPMWPTTAPYGTSDAGPVHGLLTLCPDGDLLCHMWSSSYSLGFNDGAWQGRSTDGGKTWTKSKITFQNIPSGVSNEKLYIGEDRTVIGNTIYAGVRDYHVASPQQEQNFIAKSEDNGVTWSLIGQLSTLTNPSPYGTQEMSVEYIGNNNFISILREAYNDDGWRQVSNDLGITWNGLEGWRVKFGLTSTQGIGRTTLYTRAHLKLQNQWWMDPVLICNGFALMATPGGAQRRNAVWISKDSGNDWFGPFWLDLEMRDGGYGDIFYNPNADEYVSINYTSPTSLEDASVNQYNWKLSWQ